MNLEVLARDVIGRLHGPLVAKKLHPYGPALPDAKKIGEELTLDIDHYRKHPECDSLWCVVYDPEHLIRNPEGLKTDLEGPRSSKDGKVQIKVLVL